GGKFRRCPAFVRRQFRMDKIETEKRMLFVLDASVHVHAATFAGMSLDDRVRIDHRQLVPIGSYADFVAWYDRNLGEKCASRFPAFGAAAYVVMSTLTIDRHGYFLIRAVAK